MWIKVKNFILDNDSQICELILLIIAFIIPPLCDLQKYFEPFLSNTEITLESIIFYFIISEGNFIISLALVVICLFLFRKKINKNFIMNQKNIYHNQPYLWYWICSKILGISKCNLVQVPIYLQFKLVINRVFLDFPLNENDFPCKGSEDDIYIFSEPSLQKEDEQEFNLILEDTYPIDKTQLPESMQNLPTIKISRCSAVINERHFSDKFIEKIMTTVRELPNGIRLNVFATTNPMNTKNIARRVFAMANRNNIKHLFVYQQNQSDWNFDPKEHKIY